MTELLLLILTGMITFGLPKEAKSDILVRHNKELDCLHYESVNLCDTALIKSEKERDVPEEYKKENICRNIQTNENVHILGLSDGLYLDEAILNTKKEQFVFSIRVSETVAIDRQKINHRKSEKINLPFNHSLTISLLPLFNNSHDDDMAIKSICINNKSQLTQVILRSGKELK